jgi:hypothetical protein
MTDGTAIALSITVVFPELGETFGPYETPDPSELYSFDLQPSDDVSVVRFEVESSTGGNTGAREVEVYED